MTQQVYIVWHIYDKAIRAVYRNRSTAMKHVQLDPGTEIRTYLILDQLPPGHSEGEL